MINFLIKRPIAVSMTYIALLILGIAAMTRLPVSLMPDIDIPRITVQIDGRNMSVRQLENGVVRPIRRQLLQVPHLRDIRTVTRDEHASLHLQFDYGTDVDMAFIDVNEKIDRSMNRIPRDISRPRVIKASASDIPVFYLNITAKSSYLPGAEGGQTGVSERFIQLSRFSDQVIKKRLEQLPEVAMADISGILDMKISIIPDKQKMNSLGFGLSHIEQAIRNNNIDLGNIVVRDGIYQYSLSFEQSLIDKQTLGNILLKRGNKTLPLKEVADIVVEPRKRSGLVTSGMQEAVTLAVIKKSGSRMQDMKASLNSLVDRFRRDYPDLRFEVVRDQTRLLEYSINNLGNTLLLGAVLAFAVMFFFLRDIRSPLLIGLSIPSSLIVSILFFYAFGISINIISLSGLVLGIGMMIDNSIIVIDNITQYIDRGDNLIDACRKGTNEVIRPLLSSVLTTCAVFIPLIFISGLAGALFYDQAMAIAIGLFTSFFVSITLIPVYYKLVFRKDTSRKSGFLKKLRLWDYFRTYERGLHYVLGHRGITILIFILVLAGGAWLYTVLEKERLPRIRQDEMFVSVDWNARIHVDENKKRSLAVVRSVDTLLESSSVYAGSQQFMMNRDYPVSPEASKIYLKFPSSREVEQAKRRIRQFFATRYPGASFEFLPPENVFEKLFSEEQAPLVARIMPFEREEGLRYNELKGLMQTFEKNFEGNRGFRVPGEEHVEIAVDQEKLLIYDVSRQEVAGTLKNLYSEYQVTEIKSSRQFMPIVLGHEKGSFLELLNRVKVTNQNGREIPLRELISVSNSRDFKQVVAGRTGEYFPVPFQVTGERVSRVQNKVENVVDQAAHFDVSWEGSIFSNRQMVREILVILVISLLLLYFILASQFESLKLPLIVLLEVPIDIAGSFLLLRLFGYSINIMSLIGVIVMAGIIINDSILKIDTINRLRKGGMGLTESLYEGGKRRLKPILMTSLTTIMAMVPFLFISGLGSDLQKPLAISVIGGMAVGTVVSLYFIPLFYFLLKQNASKI
jgi:multidrug efflux pump subunit AcrB